MDKKILLAFGLAVKKVRKQQGFSQESFALHAEMHRTYIGGIERGERNPTITTIFKISRALSLNPNELLKIAESNENGINE